MGIGAAAAGIAAAGAIGGAVISSNATSSAANKQAAAYNNATQLQAAQWQQELANEQPYMDAGTGALNQLSTLYGLNSPGGGSGNFTNAAGGGSTVNPNASFYLSPDYNFTLTQGLKGLTAQGAATNGTDNGATQKAEIAYAGNLASGQYDNYKSGLLSLAGLGQSAATGANYSTAGTSANESSLAAQNGSNQASAILGQGSIGSNLASSLAGIAAQYGPGIYNNLTTASSNGVGNAMGGSASDAALVAHQGGAGF
ncbi:MAG: hypothetical protein KGL20_05190 [Rhodospirillales bacterium]|nr:hypothetical protein [Rhodospirillales bacterium]